MTWPSKKTKGPWPQKNKLFPEVVKAMESTPSWKKPAPAQAITGTTQGAAWMWLQYATGTTSSTWTHVPISPYGASPDWMSAGMFAGASTSYGKAPSESMNEYFSLERVKDAQAYAALDVLDGVVAAGTVMAGLPVVERGSLAIMKNDGAATTFADIKALFCRAIQEAEEKGL